MAVFAHSFRDWRGSKTSATPIMPNRGSPTVKYDDVWHPNEADLRRAPGSSYKLVLIRKLIDIDNTGAT